MEVADIFSRDKAVELPSFMALYGYVLRQYNLPRMIFKGEGLVYHYTDANGLIGIVTNGQFWATASSFLNDPSERSFVVDEARKLLTEKNLKGRC